jgi:phosphate-selective porin OprO/OprP
MTTTKWTAAILATTALSAWAFTSVAAQEAPAAEIAAEAPPTAEEAAAQLEFLKAQVQAMQEQIEAIKKTTAENAPTYAAAPRFGNTIQDYRFPNDSSKRLPGFQFKVRGRLHLDAGYVENPDDRVATKNLGYGYRVRRARLGVQGTFPGGFSYVSEVDFANAAVSFADLFLSWKSVPESKFTITAGQHYPFQGLEQITSSNFVTTIERAQFVEAFGYARRLGLSANYTDGDFRLDVGAFSDTINAGLDNDDWQFAARATYSPETFGGRLHLGANYQYRQFQTNTQNFQYRVRPGSQLTDIRFVDTGSIAADGDQIFGLEAAFIKGPFHVAAEAQYNKVDSFRPGTVFTNGDTAAGGTLLAGDPNFFGAYAEVGFFLTGGSDGAPDTRGYSAGRFDRVRPKNGFDKGGIGAVQINARADYLDLSDRIATTGTTGQQIIAGELNGGESWIYSANVIWTPIEYVRFVLQYSHQAIEGGPRAAAIKPFDTNLATERKYSVDFIGLRSQFDF